MGVLLYYPEIESLKDTVICDMQVVFDSASNLIKNTFTFEKVGHGVCQKFREKAQFSLRDVKRAMSAHTDDHLPLEKLVDLLKDRNVLSVISSIDSEDPTYFMPCVLHSAKPDELIADTRRDSDPPSLMLRYKCGYVPIGVFPAMITNLVSQRREEWELITEGLRKNRVQFYVGDDYDKVTLILHPRFLEFAICRSDKFVPSTSTESLCAHVRDVVESTLKTVISHLNYHFSMKYKFGFECPLHRKRDHICVLKKEKSKIMECLQDPNKKELIPLEPCHKVWLPRHVLRLPRPIVPIGEHVPLIDDRPRIYELTLLKVDGQPLKIIQRIGLNWQKVAYRLKFSHEVVETIENDHHKTEKACEDMLRRWLNGEALEVKITWEVLIEAICDAELSELGGRVKEWLKK